MSEADRNKDGSVLVSSGSQQGLYHIDVAFSACQD